MSLHPLQSVWERKSHTASLQTGKYAGLRDTVRVAATLAACLVQFHSTPWLSDGWCQKNVRIFSLPESNLVCSTNGNMPMYIYRQYARQDGGAQVQAESPHDANRGCTAEIFTLGIALLELIHENSFQSMVEQNNFGVDRWGMRLTAMAWVEKIPQDHPLRLYSYDGIVEHCINFASDLDMQNTSWEDEKVWETIHGAVVAPLARLARDI